jgi:hypothetical protein
MSQQPSSNAGMQPIHPSIAMLKQSLAQLHQCEESGADTLRRLEEDKEKIKRARANVAETQSGLSFSNKLLNKMKSWWR